MSRLNVNIGILAYEDSQATLQPQVRLADLKWSLLGLPTDNFRNLPISLAPGESLVVASTARGLSFNNVTQFVITKNNDRMRISGSIGQRVSRDSGDSSTAWSLTQNGVVTRLTASSGTIPDFTEVAVGDFVNMGSGFQPFNQGQFLILSKGSNYIEFQNPYAQPESNIVGSTLSIYSSGPVQVGDTLDITSAQFSFPNQGSFPVLEVTDLYIDVLNPKAFPQTVSGVSSGIAIYPYAYKWLGVAIDRRILVGLNGSSPSVLEVEPPMEGDIVNQPGFLLKRGKVFQVSVFNPGPTPAQGFLILAE